MYRICHYRLVHNDFGKAIYIVCFCRLRLKILLGKNVLTILFIYLYIAGASGRFQRLGFARKPQGWSLVVPDLLVGRHDTHLCYFVGGGWNHLWQTPLLSTFFCQDVV
jgi:hypothetical protein